MTQKLLIFTFIVFANCIEPYEFVIHNKESALVVEGYISNISFNETKAYPSNGRYFTVKLSYTSDVVNRRGEVISTASVSLFSDNETKWSYTADPKNPGDYLLLDPAFEVEPGIKYKLHIVLSEGPAYESEWAELPEIVSPMGEIHFKETEKQTYIIKAGEEDLVTIQGISTFIDVPENTGSEDIYYRWNFEPAWIYIAPLASPGNADKKCWVTGNNYLTDFVLQTDHVGSYEKELFFIETIRNERLFEDFSVLIIQHSLPADYYYFWQELQEQNSDGAIFDKPPYNLRTNVYAVNGDKSVYGYFGVVAEQGKRWYFHKDELSYYVPNTLTPDCLVDYGPGPPAPSCTSCLGYTKGQPTTIPPEWWR